MGTSGGSNTTTSVGNFTTIMVTQLATIANLIVTVATSLNTLTVSGTSTLQTLIVQGTAGITDLTVSLTTSLATLSVSGATSLYTLNVSAQAAISSLTVNAATTLATLTTNGLASLQSLTVSATSALNTMSANSITVSGLSTLSTLTSSGLSTLNQLVVSTTASVTGALSGSTCSFSGLGTFGSCTTGVLTANGASNFNSTTSVASGNGGQSFWSKVSAPVGAFSNVQVYGQATNYQLAPTGNFLPPGYNCITYLTNSSFSHIFRCYQTSSAAGIFSLQKHTPSGSTDLVTVTDSLISLNKDTTVTGVLTSSSVTSGAGTFSSLNLSGNVTCSTLDVTGDATIDDLTATGFMKVSNQCIELPSTGYYSTHVNDLGRVDTDSGSGANFNVTTGTVKNMYTSATTPPGTYIVFIEIPFSWTSNVSGATRHMKFYISSTATSSTAFSGTSITPYYVTGDANLSTSVKFSSCIPAAGQTWYLNVIGVSSAGTNTFTIIPTVVDVKLVRVG